MANGTEITIEAQDTSFSRIGQTYQNVTHSPTGSIPLSGLTGRPTVTKPAFTVSPRVGLTNLAAIFALGPLDTQYELLTEALYDRTFAIARATALSGPTNVRGGTARMGFELAELDLQQALNRFKEVWQNQVSWASIVIGAIKTHDDVLVAYDQEKLSDNEQSIMAQHAETQSSVSYLGQIMAYDNNQIQAFTAVRHYGQTLMKTEESLNGKGVQNGSVSGFGMSSWR
jgi:hypothetical protein